MEKIHEKYIPTFITAFYPCIQIFTSNIKTMPAILMNNMSLKILIATVDGLRNAVLAM